MATVLFNVQSSFGVVFVPFSEIKSAPAVVVHWNGSDWYNPLVSPDDDNATGVRVRHNGTIYALSEDATNEPVFGIPFIIARDVLGDDSLHFYDGNTVKKLWSEDVTDVKQHSLATFDNQNNVYLYNAASHYRSAYYRVYVKYWECWVSTTKDAPSTTINGKEYGVTPNVTFCTLTTAEEYYRYQDWIDEGNNPHEWDVRNPPDLRMADKAWGLKGDGSADDYTAADWRFGGIVTTGRSFLTDTKLLATNIDSQGNRFDIVARYEYGNLAEELLAKFHGKYEDRTFWELFWTCHQSSGSSYIPTTSRSHLSPSLNSGEKKLLSVEVRKNDEVIQTVDLSTFWEEEFLSNATRPQHLKTAVTDERVEEQLYFYNVGYEDGWYTRYRSIYPLRRDPFVYRAGLGVVKAFIENEDTWYFLLEGDLKIWVNEGYYSASSTNILNGVTYRVMEDSGYSFPNDADGGFQRCRDYTGRNALFYFDKSGRRTMYNCAFGRQFWLYNNSPKSRTLTGWVGGDVWTYPDLESIRFPMPDGYYYTASLLPDDFYIASECYCPPDVAVSEKTVKQYLIDHGYDGYKESTSGPGLRYDRNVFKYSFFTPEGEKLFEVATTPSAYFLVTKFNSDYIFSMRSDYEWACGGDNPNSDYNRFYTVHDGVPADYDGYGASSYGSTSEGDLLQGVYVYKDEKFTPIFERWIYPVLNEQLHITEKFADWQNRVREIELEQTELFTRPQSWFYSRENSWQLNENKL